MINVEDQSRLFYDTLGAEGLAARATPEWTSAVTEIVASRLPQSGRILDVGCGYGRIALPLASKGYVVHGLDISPRLIGAARQRSQREGASVEFQLGSMMALPYPPNSFDATICLWSAFNELLDQADQLTAIREIHRVLKPGGLSLIEGFAYQHPTDEELKSGQRSGPDNRISAGIEMRGVTNPDYHHDSKSYTELFARAEIEQWHVDEEDWGGRNRLVAQFWKASVEST